jgi:hypothetical protein
MTRTLAVLACMFIAAGSSKAFGKGENFDPHGFSRVVERSAQAADRHVFKRHRSVVRHSRHVPMAKVVGRSVSLAGVTPVLAEKTREIVSACGSKVVSAVAGRSNKSNHPRGRAVDLSGNPSCIYAHLKNWPGGVSTDYWTAPGGKHVHVSYNPGGQEWGLRFAHRHAKVKFAARKPRLAHAM